MYLWITAGMYIEINFRNSKWLLFGTDHPPCQNDNFYFNNIRRALNIYAQKYDNILLARDFNAEEKVVVLKNFMELYDLTNLVKEKICFKPQTPYALNFFSQIVVDLFKIQLLFYFYRYFRSSLHKMTNTVLKTNFKKARPKEIVYRCYKNFDR